MAHYQENAFSRLQSNLSHKNSAQLIARGFLKPTSKHRPSIMETFIEKRIMKTNRQTSNVASDRPKCTLERHSSTSSEDTNKEKCTAMAQWAPLCVTAPLRRRTKLYQLRYKVKPLLLLKRTLCSIFSNC